METKRETEAWRIESEKDKQDTTRKCTESNIIYYIFNLSNKSLQTIRFKTGDI